MTTRIEWTDETWNPVTGCTKASPGCDHCYAERMSHRLAGRAGYPLDEPFRVTLHPDRLGEPLRWRKPRRCFVVSMGDLFHEDVPFEFVAAVFGVMAACPDSTFQVLTKRPGRALEWYGWAAYRHPNRESAHKRCMRAAGLAGVCGTICPDGPWPLPNVWLGVTAEDQARADDRIPLLLQIPAAVRFVSVEPMLGPVDLWAISDGSWYDGEGATRYNALTGTAWWGGTGDHGLGGGPRLDWVICGAETGPMARPMNLDWARSLRDQCVAAPVPFFFKKDSLGRRELDGQRWEQWPDDPAGGWR